MNFNTLDLNLLVVFDAILRTRSVTLAGENVHLSQSAMSNALKRLRRSFNDPLFVRTSMGMLPTPCAEQISKPIQDALAQIKTTIEAKNVFDPAKSERTFRIYMTDVGQMVLLPDLLERIRKEAPHVNLQTVQVPMHHREEAMESGEVDLAVGYLIPFEGHFYRQKLFTETYVCMVRAGHPTIGDQITLREFLTVPQMVFWPAGGAHGQAERLVEQFFEEKGISRQLVLRLTHFLGLAMIISRTDLLVTIPSRLAHACADLVDVKILRPPITIPSFDVVQYWHERYHQDPGNRWLRGLFADLYLERTEAAHELPKRQAS